MFYSAGRGAEVLLEFCIKLKDKFQLSWRMISLVDVILKYARDDQEEAWRQIDEGKSGFTSFPIRQGLYLSQDKLH